MNSPSGKPQWRRLLRLRRQALQPPQRLSAARRAARQAITLLRARRARHVALYLATASELSTAPLLRALLRQGTQVYVPRLVRGNMVFVPITPHTPLRRNAHGIAEPVSTRQRPWRRLDAILLPLLGFDDQGTRLGAGGGYYDRALARPPPFRRPLRVGYAYTVQHTPALPHDPWDVRLHAAVTDQGLWRWRNTG